MSTINWSEVAPKPTDQARLARLFREAGLPLNPKLGFLNGIPWFTKPVSDAEIQAVIGGDSGAPAKHTGGRPKGSHNKPK
jgi:hypothetical protein